MNLDERLRSAAQALRVSDDLVAVRRAYRQLVDEFDQLAPENYRRWNDEFTRTIEDEFVYRAEVLLKGDRRFDEMFQWLRERDASRRDEVDEEEVKRRQFLAHAAAVAVGAPVPEEAFAGDGVTGPKVQVDIGDVVRLEAAVATLESLFERYGSASCQAVVHSVLSSSAPLRHTRSVEWVRRRFLTALAKLTNLAGWIAADMGSIDLARQHFSRALELATTVTGNGLLVANILYRMGRVYLRKDAPDDALKMLQLGQIAAQESGSELAVAVICANQARAYAMMGHEEQTTKLIGRARDNLTKANHADSDLSKLLQLVINQISSDEQSQLTHADAVFKEIERRNLDNITPVALVATTRQAS